MIFLFCLVGNVSLANACLSLKKKKKRLCLKVLQSPHVNCKINTVVFSSLRICACAPPKDGLSQKENGGVVL